jgi:hypothetical protein
MSRVRWWIVAAAGVAVALLLMLRSDTQPQRAVVERTGDRRADDDARVARTPEVPTRPVTAAEEKEQPEPAHGLEIRGQIVDETGAPFLPRAGMARLDRGPRLEIRSSRADPEILPIPEELTEAVIAELEAKEAAEEKWVADADAEGRFTFSGLERGEYLLTDIMFAEGYTLPPNPTFLTAGDRSARIVLLRETEVRLRILDGRTGEPVGSRLRYEIEEVGDSPEDGAYQTGGSRGGGTEDIPLTLRAGVRVRLKVEAEGYAPCEGLEVIAGPAPGPQVVEVRLTPDESVYATLDLVIHDETGAPVTVLMIGRAGAARRQHSRDGRYELTMPAGSHRIGLDAPSDQILLYKREWIPSEYSPDSFVRTHAWLPKTIEVALERGERKTVEVAMQRAALIWIRDEPKGSFSKVRILRGEEGQRPEIPACPEGTVSDLHALVLNAVGRPRELYDEKGLVAVVPPGDYIVEGMAGDVVKRVEVRAEAAEVAEVVLKAQGRSAGG